MLWNLCGVVTWFVVAQAAGTGSFSPTFGGSPSRNMVNTVDKDLPTDWSIEEGKQKNIRWVAKLGSTAYGGPVISGGKVYVGTNNASRRDPAVKGQKAVLMCFAESDGAFLWQVVHDFPADDVFRQAQGSDVGLCSTPTIQGDRVYYVTPGCELICADTANGKAVWTLDMMKELKVIPYHLGNCSPLVVADRVFVVTGNGADEATGKVASPQAPSFIAVNKKTGKVLWTSDLPGANILEGQWSNPAYGEANGKPQVVFPGGDGWLYSLEPDTGKLIWKFNGNAGLPKQGKTLNYIVSTPVIHEGKVYVGMGLQPEHPRPTRFSYFFCIDMGRTGDVSPANLAAAPQKGDSALVWAYGGTANPAPAKGRNTIFGRTMSTAAVHRGLVYISEEAGYLHCLDAKTGQRYWDHDFLASVWGSPYWVDDKIYIGTEDREIVIFAEGKNKKIIRQVNMDETIHSTPVVANGVLYVVARAKLYAIAKAKQ